MNQTSAMDDSRTVGASGSAPTNAGGLGRFFAWLQLSDIYRRSACVLFGAFALGLLAPYALAQLRSAVDGTQVAAKLEGEAKKRYEIEANCRDSLSMLEADVAALSSQGPQVTDDVVRRLTAYEKFRVMCANRSSRISVTGYSDSNVKWLWSGLFLFLGLAVWVLPVPFMHARYGSVPPLAEGQRQPTMERKKSFGAPFLQVFGVWAVYRFNPLWRNFEAYRDSPTFDEERRNYSWTNLDIDVWGFIGQELLAILVAVLLVLVWRKWHSEDLRVRDYLRLSGGNLREDSVRNLSARVSQAFHVCIVASVLLCAAFVPYTRFFWRVVKDIGDERYFNQAVVVHFLWLVTWIVVAVPFGRLWLSWEETRNRLLGSTDATLAGLADLEPVSRSHGALSAAIALLAAVYPLVG